MNQKESHWQTIYSEKDATELSWFQVIPKLSLELIHSCQIAHNDAIIDVGGGASVLVDALLNDGFSRLAVLDISVNALACSQERLGEKADRVEWFDTDITTFRCPHSVSLWHDRAVFHFLTEQTDRLAYVSALKHALKLGGHVIIAAFSVGGPQRCSGLEIVQYDASTLSAELGDSFELIQTRDESHQTPRGGFQRFTYFHFVRRA